MRASGGGTLKLTIAYDGRGFFGSQRQAGRRTVQAELERSLAELSSDGAASAVFAGRTDAGVHAVGQVVSTRDVRPDLTETRLRRALNAGLPADVAVVAIERKLEGFHARFDARWREYRYRIWTGVRQPLLVGLVAQHEGTLDAEAMADAGARLIGTHDLAALAGAGAGVPWSAMASAPRGRTRTVQLCSVCELKPWWGEDAKGQLLELRIVADAFLPHMVRNIAGALFQVGRGKKDVDWIDGLLASKDRRRGVKTALPEGLILWRVGYDNEQPPS